MVLEKLKKNLVALFLYDKSKEFYYKYLISDEKIIRKNFKKRLGRQLNLDNPIYYNDKIQWLKLNWSSDLATQCADKYKVREYVKKEIGAKYLNKLIGVYTSTRQIKHKDLPKSFVMKATHASGFNLICHDKSNIDWNYELIKMKRWLWTNYHWKKRENVYKDIEPRIICEKYLGDEEGNPPFDYKIFCFDGKPSLIQVDIDRLGEHRQNFYDINWNFLDVGIEYLTDKNVKVEKPKNLNEMLNISEKLSAPFPHVRVDLYNVKNKIIFGELTFYHHSGFGNFSSPSFERMMGEKIDLNKA